MMRQWELDHNPYLRAILDIHAGDFSPERSGIQGAAYDKAVLDCYWAVVAVLEAQAIEAQRAETPKSGSVSDESAVGSADAPNTDAPKA